MNEAQATHPFEEEITVPADIAICPYCKGELTAKAEAWEDDDAGRMLVTSIDLTCENEFAEEDDDYEGGTDHTYMPYVYWLPVQNMVKDWMNQNIDKAPVQALN